MAVGRVFEVLHIYTGGVVEVCVASPQSIYTSGQSSCMNGMSMLAQDPCITAFPGSPLTLKKKFSSTGGVRGEPGIRNEANPCTHAWMPLPRRRSDTLELY